MKLSKTKTLLAIFSVVVTLSSAFKPVQAQAPTHPIKTEWTTAEVKAMTSIYAANYGVSDAIMQTIIQNESQYQWNDVGDHGTSFGACQIHLPAHPDITQAEAENPDFCLDWTARQIVAGHAEMWTTYIECYLGKPVYANGKKINIPCTKT